MQKMKRCKIRDIKNPPMPIAGEILAVCLYGQRLQELYLLKDGHLEKVSAFNDTVLANKYVAKPERLTVESAGYQITGWLLKPFAYDLNKRSCPRDAVFTLKGIRKFWLAAPKRQKGRVAK